MERKELKLENAHVVEKKHYESPRIQRTKINVIMLAASRSGMGNCKITFVD